MNAVDSCVGKVDEPAGLGHTLTCHFQHVYRTAHVLIINHITLPFHVSSSTPSAQCREHGLAFYKEKSRTRKRLSGSLRTLISQLRRPRGSDITEDNFFVPQYTSHSFLPLKPPV